MTDASRPTFIYGTAWKEDATESLVLQALRAGFRAVDTANQRRHYHEAGVGSALAKAVSSGLLKRDDVFVQTKFTFRAGQDHRLPYDPRASIGDQVRQSFASSLEHLGVDRLDSYVLHGPSRRAGLHDDDWEAWRAMEALHDEGTVRALGVSNVDADQLEALCDDARVQPSWVQNRCFAATGWDWDVRAICRERGIGYQGFSLLTANPHVLRHPRVVLLATAQRATPAQVVFRFARAVGMVPLSGTSDAVHARQDLDCGIVKLSSDDITEIEGLGGE